MLNVCMSMFKIDSFFGFNAQNNNLKLISLCQKHTFSNINLDSLLEFFPMF